VYRRTARGDEEDVARMTVDEANAVNIELGYLSGQNDPPEMVVRALERPASRAQSASSRVGRACGPSPLAQRLRGPSNRDTGRVPGPTQLARGLRRTLSASNAGGLSEVASRRR